MNNNYENKVKLCNILVNSKKKRITDSDILHAATSLNISYSVAKRAWQNFVETSGQIDRRKSTETGALGIKVVNKPNTVCRSVTKEEAAKILLEFMEPGTSTTGLSKKYNVGISQIYGWIHDIQISGKLYDSRILNPEKYSKPNVLTVIAYRKNPYSKSKRILELSAMEKLNYKRVADVLKDYLSAIVTTIKE